MRLEALEQRRLLAVVEPTLAASTNDVSEDLLICDVISSPSTPPTTLEYEQTFADVDTMSAADVLLTEVPTSTWTYGCTATSAGMIFGYYDRIGYSNMYTGPTNGGVAPLTNLGQGDDPDNPVAGATSIIATMDGFDGRSGAGHVDDYWISYDATGPDPWVSSGTEHTWGDCTADYLGTNQWKWDNDGNSVVDSNSDGATSVWSYGSSSGAKLYDYVPPASIGTPQTAACHGMRLFAESRGYTVVENYTQSVNTVASGGFSFSDFMSEIDAGCPVMLHVVGHTMVGVGYEAASNTVYLHDTWDNSVHTMSWGGYYVGMLMQSVTIIHLQALSTNDPPTVDLSNTVTSLPEDTDTTSRIKMADIVVSDDGVGTNVLSMTGDDAALFEIDGNELFLIAGATLDYETNPVLDVTVEVDDASLGSGVEDTASLAVTVTDVNEAPTVELTNTTTTLAEDTDTTSRLKVADIVVTDDALGTNDLSLTGDDAALFEIDGAELYLIAGATLNYETNPVLDVTVEVDDATLGTGVEDSASLAIALTDENEPPTIELTSTTTTLPEDTDTAARLKVADIVVSDDGIGTNVLSLTGVDAAFFEIDGTELYVIAGAALDFETNPVLDVTVEVDDTSLGTGVDDSDALAIAVTDVNEAPSVELANTTSSLSEDTDTTARLKVADIVVTDDALGTNVLALAGDDAALFEIDGTELYLIAGATLDYATNPALDVTVEVDDTSIGTGAEDTASLTITLIQVNDPPTITLTNTTTTLPEDTDLTTRLKVADITVTDDGVGTNSLSLTGADAALFQIVGSGLYLVAGTTLDFETNPALAVIVEVDDTSLGTGAEDSASLAIAVTDVNEAPTVELTNTITSLSEDTDTTSRVKIADIVIIDDALGTNVLSLTGVDAAMFEIDSSVLYLVAGATLEYATNPVLDVTVEVDDASIGTGADDTAVLGITLIQHNDPPTVSLTNTTTTLPEDTDLTARLKVGDIVVTDDGVGTNVLSVTGTDAALFEIDGTELFLVAGASLDFETNPVIDVTVEVDDAGLGSGVEDSAGLAITVTDANDAPTVSLTNTTTTFPEDTDTTARLKVADIVVTDDALGSYVLALSGDDAALFEIDGTELYLIAGATLDYDTNPVLDVIVEVDDESLGTGADDSASLAITVTEVNGPPTVSLANTTTTLPEDTDTSSRLKVADIVITDDSLGTNVLTLSGADAALFEIDGAGLFLIADARLDYESNSLLDVTVEVDDPTLGSTPDDTAAMQISITDVDEFDYGDAPDAATGTATGDYHTVASDSGPSHLIVGTLYLGGFVDGDDGTLQNGAANADDVDQALPDDEDGVRDPATDLALTVGTEPTVNLTVTNTTGSVATLTGWIDYNNDGVFDNATERAQATVASGTTAGIVTLTFPSVSTGFTGTTYARFRLSTDSAATDPTGYATDGEVEDYVATITRPGDGMVEAYQKISATEGNFTGTLVEDGLFGWSVANIGDLDGDGVTDMAVGARHDEDGGVWRGAVWIVFLNADGTVKSQQKISDTEGNFTGVLDDGDEFGWSVASMGDLDGDGVTDLAVGAYGDDDGASAAGAVWMLFLNPDGTVKAHQKISNTEGNFTDTLDTTDLFGTAVANVGDFDGDGVTDLAVGGYGDDDGGGPSHGAVWMLFLNSDGTVKSHQKISDTEGNFTGTLENYDLFGCAVTSVGDLDGDGVTDLAVGAHQDDDGGTVRGAVWILMLNEDGTVKSHQKISDTEGSFLGTLANYDHFGHELANVGDFDGDGVTDIAVGAYADDGGGTSRGAVWMLFLNSDGTVKGYQEINDVSGNFTGTLDDSDFFGTSVTSLGDLDGDGTIDLAVGTSADNDGGTTEGAVYVLFMETLNTPPTVSLANTTTSLPENTDLTTRLKVADIVITDDGLGTNVLSLTGADAALFEIDGTELFLVAGGTLDRETNPVLDVTVEVDDPSLGTGAEDSDALAITVTDVNEAPTVELTGTITTLPEDTDTTARLKVADIVVTDDGLGTNVLSLTGADAALFEIDGTELYLVAGAILDFETNPALDVTVEVDDELLGTGVEDSDALTITVTDVNEAPTVELTGTTTTLPEDTDLTTRLKVADIVVTDDGLGTNVLSLAGADAALFEIDGTELYLAAGAALDFETNPVLDVTVAVDDTSLGAGAEDSDVLTITVTDVNEAPTVELTGTITTLPEDTDTTARLKVADIVVTDDPSGTNVLSLTGADAALFEIDGTELYLVAGATLDFETNPVLDVTVQVDDASLGTGVEDSDALAIAVTDVNEAPTVELTGTITTLPEDTDLTTRLKVADIVVTDDGLGTNVLSLTGVDAALFEIDGTELYLVAGATLDFETNPILDVTVEVDDTSLGSGSEDSDALAITVTDVNEAPTVELTGTITSLPEDTDTTARLKVADIVVTDDPSGTNVLSLAGVDAALFEIDGTELYLVAGATLDFETNPVLDVTVQVDDASLGTGVEDTAALSIGIEDINEAPIVSLTNAVTILSEAADTSSRLKVADIVLTDDGLGTNVLTLAGVDAALFEIDGTELFLIAGAVLDHEVNPVLDVTVEVNDETLGTGVDDTADLAILVMEPSGTITLQGTTEDNTIRVSIGSVTLGTDHVVQIDGVEHRYNPTLVTGIEIDGLAGNDTITILGTDGKEEATLRPDSVDVLSSGFEFYGLNVESITVDGAGGTEDEAVLIGSSGSNRLYSYADSSRMSDSPRTYSHRADGFETVTVDGSSGTGNYAFVYDSPENDVLSASPEGIELSREDGTTTRSAAGFEKVYVYATEGGDDSASLVGAEGARNRLYSYSDRTTFTESARSFYFYTQGFDSVAVDSPGDATTYAYVYDSPGNDSFEATPTSAAMDRAEPYSDLTTTGFGRVYAYSTSGGDDAAVLTGSDAGGNRYRGYPTYSTLTDMASSFYHYARGFDSLTAVGSSSDPSGDRAYLYDSSGDDTLTAAFLEDDVYQGATLSDTAGSYANSVAYFDLVYARSSDSGTTDTIDVEEELLAYELIRSGTW